MTTEACSARAPGRPFDPYWKRIVCGDRAGLALRAGYRSCLAEAVRECGFESLRQHGMFHDDMFVWHRKDGPFEFQYLFSNYDYYLSLGLRPFVELSFLPTWMAANDNRVFAVGCAACPPKDPKDWRSLVDATVRALVDRYGIGEVRSWRFEVWNEPDIVFWKGTQAEYFEFYRQTVETVKAVDAGLRVGGPATANFRPDARGVYRPTWIEDFIAYCATHGLPVDFLSTHPYPTDFPFDDATRTHRRVVRGRDATFEDLTRLRRLVDESPLRGIPLHCNEWGSSPSCRDFCHDHPFDASFLAENLLRCEGLVDSLARWVFCDVSEESPPGPAEFHGGWGLMTVHGIRKPGFHVYSFLHRAGSTLLCRGDGFAVFRGARGWQALFWNHHHYADAEADWGTPEAVERMIGPGAPRTLAVGLTDLPRRVRVTRSLVDREHGWALPAWQAMGAPAWPRPAQIEALREAARPSVTVRVVEPEGGRLELRASLAPLAVEFWEVEAV